VSERFAFLHIGKTGGSALRHVISRHRELGLGPAIDVHGHHTRLIDLCNDASNRRVFFVVRDPVKRVVSGLQSRLRKGKWGTNEWNAAEEEMFARFRTPNEIAEALSSTDAELRRQALLGLNGSVHSRFGLAHCLTSVPFLETVVHRIAFIGHLPTLCADFSSLRRMLGLSDDIDLPGEDHVMFHKTPDTQDCTLSPLGERNIRLAFRHEFPIYEWCLAQRQRILAAWHSDSISSASIGTCAHRSTQPSAVTSRSFSSRTPRPSSGM
jgi:hypothetical protein